MLMSVLGGMSECERQHVQARVRAAMDAQVVNEGRHQGGRAPYGYSVVDGGPHPNPRKAAERLPAAGAGRRRSGGRGRSPDLRRIP
jgi:DNA invertase Pin-like site-specific DNA recombinase